MYNLIKIEIILYIILMANTDTEQKFSFDIKDENDNSKTFIVFIFFIV